MPSAVKNHVKRYFLVGLVLISLAAPLQCATLERLSLSDMIGVSTGIVRGKVVGSYAAASGPVIYTHYQLQVTERYKGSAAETVDLAVPGGAAGNVRQVYPGAPTLNAGQEYVIFLWTGRNRLTQIIGLTQGLFAVSEDGSQDPSLTRSATKELMLDTKTGQAVQDKDLTIHLSDLKSQIAHALSATGANK
jgi:hypothetical protein